MTKNNKALKAKFTRIRMRGRAARLLLLLTLACSSLFCASAQQKKPATPVEKQPVEKNPEQLELLPYQTIFYKSGDLKIEAYLYKPSGDGPFPLVIYNHGSRAGHEREEKPFKFVSEMLMQNGYAVLVPERRGYGKSDGPTFSEEVSGDNGAIMKKRFYEEADDVLAGLHYVKTNVPYVNPDRIAIMGWSHGGVVSVLAASKNHSFSVIVDQAVGALTWKRSPTLRDILSDAAKLIKAPGLCMDAENDATTDAATTVGNKIREAGNTEKTIIYPPFTPTSNPDHIAPGHLIFGADGMNIWKGDLLAFLNPIMKS